ncbi:hypothetical protein [Pseudoduganella sp. OTU4001]|uniref:hypothetical protein n=1 Tax=Pseudoduganella sp. OTU4001 TaxID=3043854 RepID=UPI00313EC891
MEAVSEVQSELELMRQHAKRQLIGTVLLGIMAAILAFVGQSALAQVQPLLAGSFGSWQSVYTFVLWALAIAWLVALVQQALHYVNMSERYEAQRRLDAIYAERAVRAQVAEELRQRQRAETEARSQRDAAARQRRAGKEKGSNKFDY